MANFRQAIQPVDLAANHLQDPFTTVWHCLDHLLSLVSTFQHMTNDDARQNSEKLADRTERYRRRRMRRPSVLSTPSLRELFERNEGRLIHKWMHYFPIYERHFAPYRGTAPTFLEIGVSHGGSLDMWRRWFGRGTHVIGIDIDERCAALAGRGIDVRIGDQADLDFLDAIVDEFGPFDIILDDGGHFPEAQIASLERLWSAV